MFGFVTGASSGVGEAFACRLAADGWDLAITARRGDRLSALAERLAGKHQVSVQVHVADLADPGDVTELERVVAAAEPDLLVNNAGFAGYREFRDVDPQVVADLVGVHVLAVSRLARAAIPGMIARGSGAIINVASLLAFSGSVPPQPLPCRAVYAGAKAFQVAFTQALAGELAGTGVQVQACCPDAVRALRALGLGKGIEAASAPLRREHGDQMLRDRYGHSSRSPSPASAWPAWPAELEYQLRTRATACPPAGAWASVATRYTAASTAASRPGSSVSAGIA